MTDGTTPRGERPCYEVSLAGHLDGHWSTWFGGLTITHEDDGTTTLRGVVADQADLHGLLAKVRDLGATLISLTLVDPGSPTSWLEQNPLPRGSPAHGLSTMRQRHPSNLQPEPRPPEQE